MNYVEWNTYTTPLSIFYQLLDWIWIQHLHHPHTGNNRRVLYGKRWRKLIVHICCTGLLSFLLIFLIHKPLPQGNSENPNSRWTGSVALAFSQLETIEKQGSGKRWGTVLFYFSIFFLWSLQINPWIEFSSPQDCRSSSLSAWLHSRIRWVQIKRLRWDRWRRREH